MLVAVDTNVLLDQALEDADVLDAIDTLKSRLKPVEFLVPPTVLEELGVQFEHGDFGQRAAAQRALQRMRSWGYKPVSAVPHGEGITQQISFRLRSIGALPDEEENDGFIIAEAALLGCDLLLTSDSHLIEAQRHSKFRTILQESDVDGAAIVIGSPRTIVRRFYPR